MAGDFSSGGFLAEGFCRGGGASGFVLLSARRPFEREHRQDAGLQSDEGIGTAVADGGNNAFPDQPGSQRKPVDGQPAAVFPFLFSRQHAQLPTGNRQRAGGDRSSDRRRNPMSGKRPGESGNERRGRIAEISRQRVAVCSRQQAENRAVVGQPVSQSAQTAARL